MSEGDSLTGVNQMQDIQGWFNLKSILMLR